MNVCLTLLALWVVPDDPPCAKMTLEAQEFEQEREEPLFLDGTEALTPMEYVYRHSQLEGGVLYTMFDGDLDVENDAGIYIRGGVAVSPWISLNVTYRHYDFTSSELPGKVDESIDMRGLLAGAGLRIPLTPEFELRGNAGVGAMRRESGLHRFSDETDVIVSLEGGATVRLHEVLRLKAGVVADLSRTEFHQTSDETIIDLSGLVALEIGGW